MKRLLLALSCLAAIATLPGCASQPVTTNHFTEAIQAKSEVPEDTLLDVSVQVFDTGLAAEHATAAAPMPEEKEGVYPEVRKSESRYFPVQLAETMQSTGNWGAVRVVPKNVDSAEILVTGKIIESTGKDLVLEIQVQDASGEVWFEKKYKEVADLRAYQSGEVDSGDPFQHVYNQIANDILVARSKLTDSDLREIRKIAELRFAADLAPDPFEDYLEKNRKGEYEVSRLPAENDPMVERIARIRERDYLLIDTLNEQYAGFYSQMERPYADWRAFSYEEQVALEELRRQARMRKIVGAVAIIGSIIAPVENGAQAAARDIALIGGMAAVQSGIAKGQEAKIHAEALKELGHSFDAEVAPMVVEIEGETLELSGSAETQYAEWRRLLREIYATETGLPTDPNVEAQSTAEEPAGN